MNRIDRLTAIILLLQGGQRTASEIARRFEISKRTVFRDIEALCEMGVPIITESGPHGGYTLFLACPAHYGNDKHKKLSILKARKVMPGRKRELLHKPRIHAGM